MKSKRTFFQSPLLGCTYGNASANKVHDHKVQDGAGKEEVSKGSLRGDALKIRFVLWVDLYSQAHYKKKNASMII